MRTTIVLWIIFSGLLLCLYIGLTHAQQPQKKTCEVSLAEKTIQAKNLDDHRDAIEQKLAAVQAQLYFSQQQAKALQDKLEELTKPQEKKAE